MRVRGKLELEPIIEKKQERFNQKRNTLKNRQTLQGKKKNTKKKERGRKLARKGESLGESESETGRGGMGIPDKGKTNRETPR